MRQLSQFLLTNETGVSHWCPACRDLHFIPIERKDGPRWDWSGDIVTPTFSPDIRFKRFHRRRITQNCHYHLIMGVIVYQKDCLHDFKGLKIDLPPLPEFVRPPCICP